MIYYQENELCFACLTPRQAVALEAERRAAVRQVVRGSTGPIGITGTTHCRRCGEFRTLLPPPNRAVFEEP